MRAAGEDIAVRNVVIRNPAIVDHMHLARGFAHFTRAADTKGTARRDIEPCRLGRRQNGVRLSAFVADAGLGKMDFRGAVFFKNDIIQLGQIALAFDWRVKALRR